MPKKSTNITSKKDGEPDYDRPLTDDEFKRGRTAMLARKARVATGMSQSVFAKTVKIPLGTIQDWEQGRREPDASAVTLLRLLKSNPSLVVQELEAIDA